MIHNGLRQVKVMTKGAIGNAKKKNISTFMPLAQTCYSESRESDRRDGRQNRSQSGSLVSQRLRAPQQKGRAVGTEERQWK